MSRQINELTIPMPWGHIKAKTWGDKRDEIILVFHGKLDNAGSFDNLIPLLPSNFYYICFDLPSHGKSSTFPPFFPNYSLNYLIVYKLIVKYFKKQSYIFLGHSFGAMLSQVFARFYPHHVKKLVMIDGIILEPVEVKNEKETLIRTIDGVISIHEKSMSRNKPRYTYKEALKRFQQGRQSGYLTEGQAALLLNRGLEVLDDGIYCFAADQRMKILTDPVQDMRYVLESLKNTPISCPTLIILAKDSLPVIKKSYPSLDVMKLWRNIAVKFVDGGHDVHITNPERFAYFVVEFLIKQESKM